MKKMNAVALFVLSSSAALGQYAYYYSDTFGSINTNWHQNGSVSGGASGLSGSSGSLISTITPPAPVNAYEVKMTLGLVASGGSYQAYLRAGTLSMMGSGTAYITEITNVTFSGSVCSGATLNIWRMIGGVLTSLASTSVPCHTGMAVRSVMTGSNAILAYLDNVLYTWAVDTQITSGQPGVGVTNVGSGNSITRVDLGPLDQIAPNQINAATVGTSSFPTHVDFQWQGVTDDANGTGVAYYQVLKNGTYMATVYPTQTSFSDPSVSAGTSYNYAIQAVDFHWNVSSVTLPITTPPAGSVDPRQVGVRPTGSYWGGAGENIDMRSGNLSFSIPLLKAKGRGWAMPFNLSYNSGNWRQDPGGNWNLGRDGGYGYGWKLQGGALLPVYQNYWTFDHFLFIDASGAEYRLDQNNGGIWTSKESIYVEYDSNTGRLYFPDGTFWVFNCTSSGTEQDSGVDYPTVIQDSNGNQVTIVYQASMSLTAFNTSSRILTINDVMGNYNFTYTTGSFPHLASISSSYPAENYSFTYLPNANLVNPITGGLAGITAQMLQMVTNTNSQLANTFTYANGNTGELSQVTFPYGGHLRWALGNMMYTGTRTQREVQYRYLAMSSTSSELTYTVVQDPSDSGRSFHYWTKLYDAGGLGQKVWFFDLTSTDNGFGLVTAFEDRASDVAKTHTDYTWALDDTILKRPYISSTVTTLDPGQSYAVTKQTTQIVDKLGNLTSMSQYDFGASTPTRVYSNTYLSDSSPTTVHPAASNYNAEHIRNRLLTSTVTQGGKTATLANNVYDYYDSGTCTSNGYIYTPSGWQWYNFFTGTDPGSKTNTFRGNVTTSYGMDMTHTLCYVTSGAVAMSIDGGHIATTQTSSQTNYTAPNAITTGSLTTSVNWTSSMALSNETGPNGDTASIGYDAAARPSTTTTLYGASTSYTYSTSPVPQTTAKVNSTDPNTNGRKTVTNLDGFGRGVQVDSVDAVGVTRSRVQMQYIACGCSPLGKLGAKSQPYDPNANGGNPPIYWTTYTYDGLGRTLSVTAPDGASITSYSYSGNTVTVTQPGPPLPAPQIWKKFTMDAFGNLTSVVEPDPSQTATTTYTYDALNHLIGVSMPRQMPGLNIVTQNRLFNYLVGNTITAYLQSATNPENGTVSYTYNSDGTLATKLDAKGQTLKYAYDSYGRALTVSLAGSPDTVLRTYTYDTNSIDSTYSQYTAGRLTTVQYNVPSTSIVGSLSFVGDTVTEMYSYTKPGQVTGKRLRVARKLSSGFAYTGDLNATWNYTTYNEGHLMGATYPGDPNGSPVAPSYNYTYDGMGRLNTMTDGTGATVVSGTTYNAAGQMLSGVDTRTYNPMGQLTSVTSGTALNITYTYPNAGQNNGKIASQTDVLSGETVTYAYDTLNRLSSAQAATWNQSFVYDPFGNLTDKNGSYQWHGLPDANTNHLGSVDANGNALNSPAGAILVYDPENRLSSVSGTTLYAYDSQNKRIWTCTLDQAFGHCQSETYYFYSPQGKLMAQFTPYIQSYGVLGYQNGTSRAYFGGRLLGSEDRLGSRGKYFPYGEDRTSPPSPPNDQVKFATYTRDNATGLDYADQRYYGASMGRFMTPDPYRATTSANSPANPQSWNRYAYVLGDPIAYRDLRGTNAQNPDFVCYVDEEGGVEDCEDGGNGPPNPGDPGTSGGGGGRPAPSLGGPVSKRQQKQFRKALGDALSKLIGDCLALFKGGAMATMVMGVYKFDAISVSADVSPTGTAPESWFASTNVQSHTVTINLIGHFFNLLVPVGNDRTQDWKSSLGGVAAQLSDEDFRALVLLHELGHLTGTLGDDTKDASLSDAFNAKILDKCFGKK